MKQKYHLLTVIGLLLFCIGETFAQCSAAQSLTVGNGICTSVFYNNSTANTVGNPPTPPCWTPNSMSHTMWFSFVAPIADIEISSNFSGTLANTQVAVYSGLCGSLTLIGCQEDVNTATGLFHTNIILHGLTPGNTYYIAVDGNGNTTGTFGICVQRSTPVGPVQPIQDCVSSQNLCGLGNIVVPDGPGGVGLSQEWPSCFGTPGERSSAWYSFTAATNGNLCFTLTPNSVMDYDFAVYNTSTSCPGTELVCNWEPDSGDGTTGLGCNPGDVQCETCLAVVAGQTYSILIDRYTAASTSGFTLDFAGTTTTFASPNPTFTNTTVCVGTPTAFTNTTNGNHTYSWTFGDGGTSSLENPTHTYASAGTYTATLLVTAVPGGCQNSVTRTVTVSAPPTVDAGIGTTVCSGACTTLSGSTNGTGSIGPASFSNNTTFVVPDADLVGIASPITVSGISPATIGATSIASVCLDIAHAWNSDVDIFLECPDGTRIELSTDNGATDDNYTNTCFSPTAATPITAGTPPFTGTFMPEQPFTNLNGCNANGTWRLIVVDDLGGITGSLTGWTITFNNNVPPFTWSPTTGMTNANTLTPTVCPTVTTTYTLTANAAGGCTTTDTVTITVGGGPTANISYAAAAFCVTDTPKSVTLTGTGAFTGGGFSSTAGLTINATTGEITPATSTPGAYVVTYTIPAGGGCPSSTTITNVTINARPTAPVLTPTHPTCTVATGSITITGAAGITYSFDGGAYSGTLIYNALAAGSSHTVTAQNAAGCISTVANITLNAQPTTPAAPILTPTHPTCTVATGSVTITGAAGNTYSFDGGVYSGTLVYSGLAAGSSHTVTAQNAAGCISPVANITLNAQPVAPAVPTLTPTHPTCTIATGSVTITGAAGLTYSFDGGAYSGTLTYNGLAAGSSHTVTAQNAAGCISPVANVTLNAQPTTPAAPTLTPTHPTCTVATGSVTITGTAGNTYSFDGGAYSSTSIYGGLAAGSSHTVTAQNAAGCISAISNITLNAQPPAPTAPTITPIHPTCTVATGSVIITGTAGLTYSFDGGPYVATLIYNGLAAGSSHTVSAQDAAGCISPVSNVTLNAQPVVPSVPTLIPTHPTCTIATGSIDITGIAGLTYSFDGGPYIATLNYSGLAAGSSHTVTAQNAAGCISPVANITLNAQPSTPAAPTLTPTHPTCNVPTGSIAITGMAGLTYSFDGGAYSSTLIYGGLAAGASHTVTAQNAAGCISSPATISLNAQPATPTTPTLTPTHPTCTVATGSITISGVAGETYSLDGGPYLPTLNYTGLTAGSSHTVTAQNAIGCISSAANITLNPQPTIPAIPTLTAIHPTCTVATGSVAITGAAGLTYSFDGGPYTATLTYSGLTAGSSHTVTAQNAAGCISAVSNITLNTPFGAPATPVVTVTQPTCTTATGSIDITNVAGLTYSFDGGPYVATLNYSGLTAGSSHTVTAQNAAGCISPIAHVTLNAQPTTPLASTATITHPTCSLATGSIDINGVAGSTYSFDGGPYVATLNYNSLSAGSSHTVTAQNAAGCISAVATFTLNTQPTTPGIPTLTPTHPTCAVATGTIDITGISGLTYSFDGGPYVATLNYSGLAAGSSHSVTAQNAAGCISAVANITLNAQPLTPMAPTLTPTQPTCTIATGSIAITGTPGLTYSFDGGPYTTTLTYSGLAASSSHTVIAQNAAGCISAPVNITLNPQPPTATTPTFLLTQPACITPTGTLTIVPDVGSTYSVNGGAYSSNLIYTGLAPVVNHTINAINSDGCVSPTINFSFNSAPGTPATPIINVTQPTCTAALGSVTVVTLPTTLLFNIDGGPYSINTTFSGLSPGSHTVTAQSVFGCISAPATFVINAQPTTPTAPTIAVTQPNCTVATGSLSITGVVGLTYSIDGGPYSTTLNYSGIAPGAHQLTAQNAAGCMASTMFTINPQPTMPLAPILTRTNPTCTLATGSVTITPVAGLTYSFDGGPYSATLNYSGLTAGSSHTVTAQNTDGCISPVSTIVLFAQPSTPAPPPLSVQQHPTCTNPTGTINIGGVTTGMLYSLDGGPYLSLTIFHNLAPGLHTVSAQNMSGCISTTSSITLNPQPPTPSVPVVNITQPTCTNSNASLSIVGVPGQTYSLDGGAFSTTLNYSELPAGTSHTVTTKNAVGCTSAVANVVINAQPITPVASAAGVQTICSGNPTAIALSSIAAGTVFSWTVVQTGITGAIAGTGSTISQILTTNGNVAGQAVYTITPVANGCTGLPISFTVTVNPIPVALANAPTATICSGMPTNVMLTGPVSNTTFNWTVVQTGVSGASAGSGNTITQILNATGINPGTAVYSITPVKNGCSGSPIQVVVTVNPRPQLTNLTTFDICDGDSANINLTATIPGSGYNWTIVESNVTGASAGTGSIINQALSLTGSSAGTVVYTITPFLNNCSGNPINVTVRVNPLPKPNLTGGIICVDQSTGTTVKTHLLHSGLNNSDYHFEWTRDGGILTGNSNSYEADIAGNYSVIAIHNITGCVSAEVFATVTTAFIGDGFSATVTDAFTENATIIASIPNGTGPFYFQLNNGPKQTSNIFTGVSGGTYTILVTDAYGCTELSQEVTVIDYPKFFTPNGDGYNDYWNISGLDDPAKISIFDRYGKLVKQISTEGIGWDGTYNGAMLPSTDYWFTIDYRENKIDKIFKAHFSLKR